MSSRSSRSMVSPSVTPTKTGTAPMLAIAPGVLLCCWPCTDRLQTVLAPRQLVQLQNRVEEVEADPAIVDYLMDIVTATRTSARLRMGVSPRGNIALFRAARAYALTRGRTYLVPDDVRDLVVPCLAHRILPAGASGTTLDIHDAAAGILETLLEGVEAPV